jgi:hypothetical protein
MGFSRKTQGNALGNLAGPLLGLLVLFIVSSVPAQTPAQPAGRPIASGLRTLSGADARKVEELDKAIEAAMKSDRSDEAIARAQELLALRTRVDGPRHLETVDADWILKTLRQLALLPREELVAYRSSGPIYEQAQSIYAQQKHAQAQPLYEPAALTRRL